MFCPKDRVKLEKMEMVGVELDFCPSCNGCWLDERELELLTRSRGAAAVHAKVTESRDTGLRCPRCEGALREGHHETMTDLLIDECPDCRGIWLDRGELRQLLAARA